MHSMTLMTSGMLHCLHSIVFVGVQVSVVVYLFLGIVVTAMSAASGNMAWRSNGGVWRSSGW